ncbi:MAG: helix-turn-helix domain-containing protein [Rhodothermales bacterium]
MAGTPVTPSLRSFLDDLVALRELRGMDRDAIHQATKINLNLIEQFELNALVAHPLFNEVYQRAILRSYAGTIRISDRALTEAFEAALAGAYRRELAVAYLGLPPQEAPAPVEQPEAVEPAERVGAPVAEPLFEFRPAEPTRQPATRAARFDRFGLEPRLARFVETARDTAAAAMGIVSRLESRALFQWGGILAAIVVAGVLITQFLSRSPATGASRSTELVTLPPAAAAASDVPAGEPQRTASPAPLPALAIADIVLHDSLTLVVVAEKNKLDPFKVQVDRDLRRPYWLDQGDTLRFTFLNRIAVEERLDDMAVWLEGHRYPLIPADTSGRVVINRDSIRLFLAQRQLASRR